MATNIRWISNYKILVNQVFILIILLFLTEPSSSQTINNNDDDLFDKIKKSTQTIPKLYIAFDNKNSFISNRSGWFIGGKLGLQYENNFRYGVGFYILYNKTYSTYVNGIKKSEEYLSFNYLSLFAEYIFKNNKNYEFSLPIAIGFGYSWLGDFSNKKNSNFQLLYETQLNGMYYPLSFLGVGAGVGYRIMIINNNKIDEQFTAPIYSIKFKIIFGKLFKNERFNERRI